MEPYQAAAAYLSEHRGAEFDAAYLRDIVEEHEGAVDDFAAEAKEGHNPQLKAYAAKILPTLEVYLQLTRDLGVGSRSPRSRASACKNT